MANFVDHLKAEILGLERSLETDPRFVKLRELRRVYDLYEAPRDAATTDSPSINEVRAPKLQKRPSTREMSPATRAVVNAATEYLTGRTNLVPLRTLYHHITEERGIQIGGEDKINNLSAILYRYGFEAEGRAGWRLKQPAEMNVSEPAPAQDDPPTELSCALRSNGAAHEIHGAATV
jgi:hypothetical protein